MSEQTELSVEKPKRQIDPKILERREAVAALTKAEDRQSRLEARAKKSQEAFVKVQVRHAADAEAVIEADLAVARAREHVIEVLGISQNGEG